MIVINPSTRQFNIPGTDLVFGVTADAGSTVKEFQCPRYVGNNLDLTGCFIRMNYRNANGEIDSKLIENVTVDGDNIVFGWELTPKVTRYKGNISFVMCVVGPDTKVAWHTTLGRGQVLEGLEPETDMIEEGTADVVAALIAMVEVQTEAVENKGAEWVRNVQSEGTDQIKAVQTAGKDAETAAVAEIEAKGVNVRESIPDDYTALSEAVDGLVRGRAGAIICEAAGSAITVNDASDMKIRGLRVFGRSTQDGTPSPDAPVEIKSVVEPVVTVCGKNIFNISAITSNGSVVNNGNGTITATKVVSQPSQRFAELCPGLCPGDVATFSFVSPATDGTNQFNYIYLVGAKETWKNGTAKTVTQEMLDGPIYFYASKDGSGNGVATTISDIQVELGDTSTQYESYKVAQTIEITHTLPGIPVTSGGNYTDSDGQQWICDEVDLERGVYVRRLFFKKVTDFTKAASYSYDGAGTSCAVAISESVIAHTALCSHFVIAHKSTTIDRFNLVGKTIYFKLTGELSWEEWVERMSELSPTVVGVLDTPTETTLSETEIAAYRALHSNYPNTTILNDAGAHMVVKYAADTKLYIDNKIAALVGG